MEKLHLLAGKFFPRTELKLKNFGGHQMKYAKKKLTIEDLISEAKNFCEVAAEKNHATLIGVTDGKAVGTYIEHEFKNFLKLKYTFSEGNSAKGIDLPDENILTDIKVTSITQPQSSCPFKNARQKIFGLGYNLLVFVYEKIDTPDKCKLNFLNCTFVEKSRTADFTVTKRLIEMLKDGAIKDDIFAYLSDRNIPGDDTALENLAEEILKNPPRQGYLTISNALQWRLQYTRVINLKNSIEGILNYDF